MYSFGMSVRDIQRHLQRVYGVGVSPETISNITESVMADVREWQSRPLEKSYPILFLDALRVNSRQDGRNVNKALYVALAINWEGKKVVLVLWLADTEGAKFWMGVLADIKNRGVDDVLVACMDGLTGFPDAVKAVFPDTHIQHCIVHMVRNSTSRYCLTGVFSALINPCHLHRIYDRGFPGSRIVNAQYIEWYAKDVVDVSCLLDDETVYDVKSVNFQPDKEYLAFFKKYALNLKEEHVVHADCGDYKLLKFER